MSSPSSSKPNKEIISHDDRLPQLPESLMKVKDEIYATITQYTEAKTAGDAAKVKELEEKLKGLYQGLQIGEENERYWWLPEAQEEKAKGK
ncbi:hypothetical protein Dda_8316 [Drechslerella dactyloides]|uniref:Uncharacterized protein n=1 Tax=Drechslerella dactyloides TaxID=74499 RepID=A0AAD6NGH7_DREDA|nr:hypothetical protein Dda_8316 [Drechslerella dactyloides]